MKVYRCVSESSGLLPVSVLGAHGFVDRFRGLMLRKAAGYALWLRPCSSVHTFGMRFPLHILFLDAEGRLIRVLGQVPCGRAAVCRGARSVLEVPAGLLHHAELPPAGDYLSFRYGEAGTVCSFDAEYLARHKAEASGSC